jgi:hypothetical protein
VRWTRSPRDDGGCRWSGSTRANTCSTRPEGSKTLLDLFDGRNQLVVYQFMDDGPDEFCPGCTNFANSVTDLANVAAYGVSCVIVSDMPLAQIEPYKAKMGWTMPFVSSRGTRFARDTGAGDLFMPTAFPRDGDQAYRTYAATSTGCCSSTTSSTSRRTAARRTGRTPRPAGPSTPHTADARGSGEEGAVCVDCGLSAQMGIEHGGVGRYLPAAY